MKQALEAILIGILLSLAVGFLACALHILWRLVELIL